MRGLEWGRLYEEYHHTPYNPAKVSQEVQQLYGDPYIKNRRGIFEYILGGSVDNKNLLEVRVYDDATKKNVYSTQTATAKATVYQTARFVPLDLMPNKSKIWGLSEMDADHVSSMEQRWRNRHQELSDVM